MPFCTLFAGLGSTNQSAISRLFSSYLTLALSSPPSFLLSQTLWQICLLSPVLSGYNGSTDTHFYRGTTQLARRGALLAPSAIPCSLSPLTSRLRCNGHSLLLGSYLFRIGRIKNPSCSACGHSSQDISNLILHCPATNCLRRSLFGDSLSLYDLWSRPWGVARLVGLHGLPPCPHPSEGVG